jgi:hypothetical protein
MKASDWQLPVIMTVVTFVWIIGLILFGGGMM